jgi:hypothetical protein
VKGMELKINLERSELAILVLHMNLMRKAIKKGFKSNYGLLEGRKKIKLYDSIKERFESELKEHTEEELELQNDVIDFVLVDEEINMTSSFLTWYLEEIKKSAKVQGVMPNKDEQISILMEINEKLNRSIELLMEEVS